MIVFLVLSRIDRVGRVPTRTRGSNDGPSKSYQFAYRFSRRTWMTERDYLVTDGLLDMRLLYLDDRLCLYRPFLRPRTMDVVNEAIFGKNFAGGTDPSALSLLAMMCAICQPLKIL